MGLLAELEHADDDGPEDGNVDVDDLQDLGDHEEVFVFQEVFLLVGQDALEGVGQVEFVGGVRQVLQSLVHLAEDDVHHDGEDLREEDARFHDSVRAQVFLELQELLLCLLPLDGLELGIAVRRALFKDVVGCEFLQVDLVVQVEDGQHVNDHVDVFEHQLEVRVLFGGERVQDVLRDHLQDAQQVSHQHHHNVVRPHLTTQFGPARREELLVGGQLVDAVKRHGDVDGKGTAHVLH